MRAPPHKTLVSGFLHVALPPPGAMSRSARAICISGAALLPSRPHSNVNLGVTEGARQGGSPSARQPLVDALRVEGVQAG